MDFTAFLDPLATVCSVVFNKLWDPIVQHLTYPIQVTENFKSLTDSMEDLMNKKKDVMDIIAAEERKSRKPTHQVQGWLQHVEDLIAEVEKIKSAYGERNCKCISGASFNCWSNYSISKHSVEALQQAKELHDKVPSSEVAVVESPPAPIEELSTTSMVSEQLETNLEEALRYIREDEKASVIGIWGMGGVGKTTLLTNVNNSCIGDSMFDFVIWIVVSKDCNPGKVMKDIIKKLGLKEEADPQDQANIISKYLREKNFLLLLDDVWEPLDLLKIGIPHPLGIGRERRRKVILTTRSKEVCGNMEAHRRIEVKCLNWKSSWLLFQEKVGEQVIQSHPLIPSLAMKVAKECDGLPLALITIGRAMSSKNSPEDWEHAINLLKKSRLPEIPGTDKNTFPLLKFSYDSLESDKMRECFLCCSLWPEDYNISKDELVECWMGLDLLDHFDNIGEAYHLGYSLIESLQAACLLERGDEPISVLANTNVKMHDVIRDMALWIVYNHGESKNKWMVRAGLGLKDVPLDEVKWRKAEKVSLMHNKIGKFPECLPSCPNLTTLMLQFQYKHPQFGDRLHGFPLLHKLKYMDLSHSGIFEIPKEIGTLVELQYLNLSNTHIQRLPKEMACLKKLKYLLLRDNDILEIPRELIPRLVKPRVLDLFGLYQQHPYGSILEDLKHLEGYLKSLGIVMFSEQDLSALAKLSRVPVRDLCIKRFTRPYLEFLSPNFLGSRNMQMNLKVLNISDCQLRNLIIDKEHQDEDSLGTLQLESLRLIHLKSLNTISWNGLEAKELFTKLRKLILQSCGDLEHVTWVAYLPCLGHLEINHCSGIKKVVDSVEDIVGKELALAGTENTAFPCLRVLILSFLTSMDLISDSALTFPSLEYLEIKECHRLKKLPFRSRDSASKLQKIKINVWDYLEWEDDNIRSSFLPLFETIHLI